MKYITPRIGTLFHYAVPFNGTSLKTKIFPKWPRRSLHVRLQLMGFTTFPRRIFVDTYSEDDPTLLECFQWNISIGHFRSRPGGLAVGWLIGVCCFQVRKMDVPNKSTHLHFRFRISFIGTPINKCSRHNKHGCHLSLSTMCAPYCIFNVTCSLTLVPSGNCL